MQVLGTTQVRALFVVALAAALLAIGSASAHTASASSQISIDYAQGVFSGRVTSSEAACEAGRAVELYEVREGGPDALVGSTTTDSSGNWSISLTVDDGMFYAVAPATADSSYLHFHECGRADSDTSVIEDGEQTAVLGARETRGRDASSGGPEVLGAGLDRDDDDGIVGAGVETRGEGAGWIPFTGRDLLPFAIAGGVLIVAGVAALIVRRRRGPRSFVPAPPSPSPPPAAYPATGLAAFSIEPWADPYEAGGETGSGGGALPVAPIGDRLRDRGEPSMERERPPELREYLAVITARKWTVIVITLLAIAGAVTYSLRQTPLYQAGARVFVSASSGAPAQTTATESQLVVSEQVAALVGEELGVEPDSLLGGVSVEAVEESQVLSVSYISTDPEFAAEAANSFATNYLQLRQEQALLGMVAERRATERRVRSVESDLQGVLDELAQIPAGTEDARLDALQTEQLSLSARLGVLRQQLEDVRVDETLQPGSGEVIQHAAVPTEPVSPDVVTNGLLGLLFGLGLGIGAAFLRRELDNRFQERTDVERILGAPVLATISKFKVGKDEQWPVVTLGRPHESASEAYRGLRTNLQVIMDRNRFRSLLITSPSAGEGKTITAANLAVAFAQAGRRVALVSADLRRPRIELYFRIRSDYGGLSAWLAGGGEFPELSPTSLPNLDILPCGPTPPNPSELLTSPRLGLLVEELKKTYHLVIFDSAPLLPVADAVGLAYQLDATVMVVDAAATHRTSTAHAREKLERVGGHLIGAVLNAYDPSLPYYFHELDYYYAAEAFAAREPVAANGNGRHSMKTPRRGLFGRG